MLSCTFVKTFFFDLSTILTINYGSFFLLKQIKWELLQICKHKCNDLSKPLNPNLWNYDYFNPLSLNQIKKRTS
jgi:hypothetical protein